MDGLRPMVCWECYLSSTLAAFVKERSLKKIRSLIAFFFPPSLLYRDNYSSTYPISSLRRCLKSKSGFTIVLENHSISSPFIHPKNRQSGKIRIFGELDFPKKFLRQCLTCLLFFDNLSPWNNENRLL